MLPFCIIFFLFSSPSLKKKISNPLSVKFHSSIGIQSLLKAALPLRIHFYVLLEKTWLNKGK